MPEVVQYIVQTETLQLISFVIKRRNSIMDQKERLFKLDDWLMVKIEKTILTKPLQLQQTDGNVSNFCLLCSGGVADGCSRSCNNGCDGGCSAVCRNDCQTSCDDNCSQGCYGN